MTLSRPGLRALLTLCLLCGLAAWTAQADSHGEQPTAWDQAEATRYAEQLNGHIKKSYDELSRQDRGRRGAGQSHVYVLVRDRLRVARNESRHLERALKAGGSRDETIHTFDRLMTMIRDARNGAERLYLEAPLIAEIDGARTALRGLAPYYDPSILAELDQAEKQLRTGEGKK